jgi:hypothetical protein
VIERGQKNRSEQFMCNKGAILSYMTSMIWNGKIMSLIFNCYPLIVGIKFIKLLKQGRIVLLETSRLIIWTETHSIIKEKMPIICILVTFEAISLIDKEQSWIVWGVMWFDYIFIIWLILCREFELTKSL